VGFELRGSKGSSGPITVAAGQDSFQRGGRDAFSYKRPYLGQLQQLVVWHDNSGAAAGGRGSWGLEAVVVSCKTDGQVVTFPYGGCLSAGTQLKVELLPGQGKSTTRSGRTAVSVADDGVACSHFVPTEEPHVLSLHLAVTHGVFDAAFSVAGTALML
jgi:hypothetical protein